MRIRTATKISLLRRSQTEGVWDWFGYWFGFEPR